MRKHANRTYLFAPGNHERRVEKALGLGSDVVILDLEDAVAVSEKEKTRHLITKRLQQTRNCAVFVRINAYDTDFCFGDIYSIVSENLDGIVLPKLESAADLKSVDWFLGNLERERDLTLGSIELMPIIETAKGAVAIRDIAKASSRVRRLAFGGGDYTKDLSMEWTLTEEELLPIRSEFVLASRYGELEPPIDTVFIHIKEHTAYLKSCQNVLKLGFQGKMCIHPDQVAVTNKTFTPSNEEVVWSKRVISEFERAEAEGVASIQVDGYFVDYPIVEKAQRIVDMANLLKELNSPS
ncbi:MAG: CoA ester lyase [Pseudomonadota bacterium]|nr:CoA ester lyase [Rhodospirillaceae bacterium]MEC9101145.1 CoA ester lyase [Pseudomonadota bacterium]|tara:strand:+ start:287 stop:1174 length:888 start_codon:yes stop_codon:yes gene_type:complete